MKKIQDSIFHFYEIHPVPFFSVETIRTYDDSYSNEDGTLVTIYIRSDRVYE